MKNITYIVATLLFTCFMLPTTGYSQNIKPETYITYKDQKYVTFSNIEVNDSLLIRLQNVANKMSDIYIISKTLEGTDVVYQVNRYISYFLELDRKKDNTKQIISFWNTYSKYLICTGDPYMVEVGRIPEHVLKRAVSTNTYSEMFFKYLMRFEPGVIDFNAVEIVDGKEETLIDYLDKIIASEDFEKNYNTSEVKKLRKDLTLNFNAKTASQLKN